MNVESIKTELVKIIGNVTYVHAIIENVSDKLKKSDLEIEKLNSIIDELRDENERLKTESKGGEA
jgi:chromosome segregation ATPase